MRISALLAATLATFGLAQLAGADAQSNVGVSAIVEEGCTITGNPLTFGNYDTVSGAQVDGTATVTVACTSGTNTTITLGEGLHANPLSSADAPLREMSDGVGSVLRYALFSNGGRTTVWGNTLGTGLDYSALSSAAVNQTVFGRIAANQDVPAGNYADTVIATIAF